MNDVMNIVKEHGPIAAPRVAGILGLTIEETYHALVRLYDCGAVRIVLANTKGNGKWVAK